jgi:hypothetical protein
MRVASRRCIVLSELEEAFEVGVGWGILRLPCRKPRPNLVHGENYTFTDRALLHGSCICVKRHRLQKFISEPFSS